MTGEIKGAGAIWAHKAGSWMTVDFLERVAFKLRLRVRMSRRQERERHEVKSIPGGTFFVLKSYFSDINITKPVFLCFVFICHIFFLSLCFQVPASFYFGASFVDSIWVGLAFWATGIIPASYTQVLWLWVSTLLYLFPTCPFCVCVPLLLLSCLLSSPSNVFYYTFLYPLLASYLYLLITVFWCG